MLVKPPDSESFRPPNNDGSRSRSRNAAIVLEINDMDSSENTTCEISQLWTDGFTEIGRLSERSRKIAVALENLHTAWLAAAERNPDEFRSLVTAARRLADLIDGSAVRE